MRTIRKRKVETNKREDKARKRIVVTEGEDTIAAVATPYGEGGIGIIRMSGSKALEIIQKIFVSNNSLSSEKKRVEEEQQGKEEKKNENLSVPESVGSAQNPEREKGEKRELSLKNRYLTYGTIIDPEKNEEIDEVLVTYMKSPATYTCEDVVEINCHGSIVSLRRILALVLNQGARPAERGEFTKRAFLNGRLDLSQAEAVADLVSANTDQAQESALSQLQGKLSDEIISIRERLMDLLVDMAVNIDYPDEDIEPVVYEKLKEQLLMCQSRIETLIAGADTGRIIKEGINVAIVGKPNAGKSSLLNALLGEDRAIVTDIPGTTRDIITEFISIKDIPVNIVDTAGIRESADQIEKIGIDKSVESIKKADLVFFVIDGSRELDEQDAQIIEKLRQKKTLCLINKQDLEEKVSEADVIKLLPGAKAVRTSFTEMKGLEEVKDAFESLVFEGKVRQKDSLLVTNARHENLLKNASKSLEDAIGLIDINEALEILEIDVRSAYESMGEILGESLNDDIIEEVFARFCLGK